MKRFSQKIRTLRDKDARVKSFKDSMDAIISSERFIEEFKGYIDNIALYKSVGDGRKYRRSTDYAAIGIMDINDLIQEAYLSFLEAYDSIDWNKIDSEAHNKGGMIWGFIKKTTILNFERALRQGKDGVRIPEYAQPENVNILTNTFGKLEEIFSKNIEEVSMTRWEADLVGAFMDVHMDDHLDLTRYGNRDLKKSERAILKSLYGLDEPRKTYAELSEYYGIPQPTIRQIKKRAIKRLQSEKSKEEIADFLIGYSVRTQADIEKYKK